MFFNERYIVKPTEKQNQPGHAFIRVAGFDGKDHLDRTNDIPNPISPVRH